MVPAFWFFLFAGLSFLLGLLLVKKTNQLWNRVSREWAERLEAEGLSENEPLPAWYARSRGFYRLQYRLRMSMGVSLLLLAPLWIGTWYCLNQKWMHEGLWCILGLLGLCGWMGLCAAADAVRSYIFLAKEDAFEIIAEEKELLRKAMQNKKNGGKH